MRERNNNDTQRTWTLKMTWDCYLLQLVHVHSPETDTKNYANLILQNKRNDHFILSEKNNVFLWTGSI